MAAELQHISPCELDDQRGVWVLHHRVHAVQQTSLGQRGTGLGRKLMQAVTEAARSWGATYCKLSVYGDNEPAQAFYKRLGFRISDTERVLVLDNFQ